MSESSDPRLDALEERVAHLEQALAKQTSARPGRLEPPAPSLAPPPPAPGSQPVVAADPDSRPWPERERRDLNLDSEMVLKWGGVALVVLAVGFAVSTAISRGWIGPELQLAGAVALVIALVLRLDRPVDRGDQGLLLLCRTHIRAGV